MARILRLIALATAVMAGCTSPPPEREREREPATASTPEPQPVAVELLFARVVERHAALDSLLDFIAQDELGRAEFDDIELTPQPGSTDEEWALCGADRAALSGYLQSVATRKPELQLPSEFQLAFGLEPQQASSGRRATTVRAYWLERASWMEVSQVRGATIKQGDAGQDVLVLTLQDHDAEAFGRLTTDALGHMIAIVVAGDVISAPLVRDAITEGVVHISMGAVTPSDGPGSTEAFGRRLLGDNWAAANEDSIGGLRWMWRRWTGPSR